MPISAPTQIAVPFATSGLKNTIPANANNTTGNAGFDLGFPSINMTATTAGGIPPFGQDFNGILFSITTALQYLEAGGSFPFNSTFSTAIGGYPLGAIVSRTDGTGLWRNVSANNTTDPEAGGAGWQPEDAGSTSVAMTNANVTLTPLQAARSLIVITGTLSASLNLIFPAYIKQWLVINNATGAFTVTAKTTGGSGVVISTGGTQIVYGDGTNIAAHAGNSSQTWSAAPATQLYHAIPLQQMAGVIGGIRNGRMSVTAASASATFTADEIAVKSAFGGVSWLLNNFSKTINLATTGAGGMDTGSAPVSGYVAIYAIYQPVIGAYALLAANATSATASNVYSGVNMPSGYTASALVSVWATNGSSQLVVGYQIDREIYINLTQVLSSTTTAPTPSALTLAPAVPFNAKTATGIATISSSTNANITFTVSPASTGNVAQQNLSTAGCTSIGGNFRIPLITPQVLWHTANITAGTITYSISITSYQI